MFGLIAVSLVLEDDLIDSIDVKSSLRTPSGDGEAVEIEDNEACCRGEGVRALVLLIALLDEMSSGVR